MKISLFNFVFVGIIVALFTVITCSTALAAITNEGVTKLVDINQNEESNPHYSPDGNKIVFCTSPYTDHNSASMWILNHETNEMTKINVPDSQWLYYSTWSPDGNKILFTDSIYGIQNSGRVYTINLDGSDKTCLTCDNIIGTGNADINPNGKNIVYCTTYDSGSRGDIWIMNSDGSGKTQLTDQGGYESSPVFNPDGTKIAYSAGTESNKHIWVMDADGNNKKQLTFNSQMENAPAWSPDGNHIAYQKSLGVNQPWNIWVMKADGSEQTQLTDYSNDGIDGVSPDWSPDGKKLVFCSGGMDSNPMNTDWNVYEMTLGQKPDVSQAYPSKDSLWPANNKYVDITIQGVTDPDDEFTIAITSITSDEPTTAGGKNMAPDADPACIGTETAKIRAERNGNGNGNGRVYEITFVATDSTGAQSIGTAKVCVPHDQGKGSVCIDDGQFYDATGIN